MVGTKGGPETAHRAEPAMADVVPPDVRSRMMSGIRGKNTQPELILRRGLHALGFRFRLHNPKLPGKPDLSFPRYRAVVFAHGCFWHGHGCTLFKWPASNAAFWRKKIKRNREVDQKHRRSLRLLGWRTLTVWECSLKGPSRRGLHDVLDQVAAWIRTSSRDREIQGRPLRPRTLPSKFRRVAIGRRVVSQ